jgi:hypothetical protein
MSRKVKNIDELRTVAELKTALAGQQRELNAAYKTIDKLLKDSNKKEEKLRSLEGLIQKTTPMLLPAPKKGLIVSVSPEEEIAELQLSRLREDAQHRKLTLEEARIYDLLVKNKRLSQEKSTVTVENPSYKEVPLKDLLEIAGKVDGKSKTSK